MDAKAIAEQDKRILAVGDEGDARLKAEAIAEQDKRILAVGDEGDARLNQQDLVTNWPEAVATSVLHKTNTALNAAGIATSHLPEFFSNIGTDIQQGWHDLTNAEGERPEDTDYWKKVRDRGRANRDNSDERYERAKVAENYPITDFVADPVLVGEIALTGPFGLARKGLSKAAISTLKKQAAAQATTKGSLKDMIMDKTKRALMDKKGWSDTKKSFTLGGGAESLRNTKEDGKFKNAVGGGVFNVAFDKIIPPIGKFTGGVGKAAMGSELVQNIIGAPAHFARKMGKLKPRAAPKFDTVGEEKYYNIALKDDLAPEMSAPQLAKKGAEGLWNKLLTTRPLPAIAKKVEDILPTPNRHISSRSDIGDATVLKKLEQKGYLFTPGQTTGSSTLISSEKVKRGGWAAGTIAKLDKAVKSNFNRVMIEELMPDMIKISPEFGKKGKGTFYKVQQKNWDNIFGAIKESLEGIKNVEGVAKLDEATLKNIDNAIKKISTGKDQAINVAERELEKIKNQINVTKGADGDDIAPTHIFNMDYIQGKASQLREQGRHSDNNEGVKYALNLMADQLNQIAEKQILGTKLAAKSAKYRKQYKDALFLFEGWEPAAEVLNLWKLNSMLNNKKSIGSWLKEGDDFFTKEITNLVKTIPKEPNAEFPSRNLKDVYQLVSEPMMAEHFANIHAGFIAGPDRGIKNFKSKVGQRLVDGALMISKPAYRKEAWARGDREKEEGLRRQRRFKSISNMRTVR